MVLTVSIAAFSTLLSTFFFKFAIFGGCWHSVRWMGEVTINRKRINQISCVHIYYYYYFPAILSVLNHILTQDVIQGWRVDVHRAHDGHMAQTLTTGLLTKYSWIILVSVSNNDSLPLTTELCCSWN